MDHEHEEQSSHLKKERTTPVVSASLADGSLVEMVYQPAEHRTLFCVWDHDAWRFETRLLVNGERLTPYSPNNNLLRNEVVLFASAPAEFDSEENLIQEIRTFIHRYVDVSPLFEEIATYYVLLSWVYDRFNVLPYLRLRGDPGSGKSRFLQIVGAICYKPIFASGASTVSPLFRILDAVRGTLIIDEGDFRFSDERAEIVKILNNGNARGFPVLRSEAVGKEFNPRAYAVFGPKLVATRGFFEDRALESRCLTEEMGQFRLRNDVPITLPSSWHHEALQLRNKLLLFRFTTASRQSALERFVDRAIEPRLNQIFVPLLSIIENDQARQDLQELARRYHSELITDRGMDAEAQILEVIQAIVSSGEATLGVKEIASWFADRHAEEYERKITPKWIGKVIRQRLQLKTQKSHGVFVIPVSERTKLTRLYEKYGLAAPEAEAAVQASFDNVG